MPDTSQQLPMRFDYYLKAGVAWAHLLQPFLSPDTTLVELCPGWSPKIILGCVLDGYMGKYLAVDMSETSLNRLEHFYDRIETSFTFSSQIKDILKDELPAADIVTMNHVLDDVLLQVFDQTSYDIEELRIFWKKMAAAPELDSKVEELSQNLASRVTQSLHPGGKLIIHQYPSYQEQLHDIPEAWTICQKFMETFIKVCVKKNFTQLKFDNNLSILEKN